MTPPLKISKYDNIKLIGAERAGGRGATREPQANPSVALPRTASAFAFGSPLYLYRLVIATTTHKDNQGLLNNCVLQAPVTECWHQCRINNDIVKGFRKQKKIMLPFRSEQVRMNSCIIFKPLTISLYYPLHYCNTSPVSGSIISP